MEQIVDVNYQIVEGLEEKSTEELTTEANSLWQQMETIGAIGIMMAGQAGQRLTIIKERIGHGGWGEWVKNNLKFSQDKAENMIKLGRKMSEENSLFSNSETFRNIGISKIYALLSAPEEVAKEIIENPEMPDMTVRELKEEILRLKEKNAELSENVEKEQNINSSYADRIASILSEKENLESELETLQEEAKAAMADPGQIAEKESKIKELEEKLKKQKEKEAKLKEKLEKEKADELDKAKAEVKALIEKAVEDAEKTFQEKAKDIQKENEALQEKTAQLEKKLQNYSQEDIIKFKVKFDQIQEAFNACLASVAEIETTDEEQAGKMRNALKGALVRLAEGV